MTLDDYIEGRRNAAFGWGAHDCCTFAADWVLAATGRDPMADLRGLDSPLSAMRRLRDLGGFLAAGTAGLGEPVPGLMARRGDVVMVASGRRPGRASGHAFGVHTGSHIAAPGRTGLVFLSVLEGLHAWRVVPTC